MSKTKLCELHLKGECTKGENCTFAHDYKELRSTPDMFKTALCTNFLKGNCKVGRFCRFAHGEAELKQ